MDVSPKRPDTEYRTTELTEPPGKPFDNNKKLLYEYEAAGKDTITDTSKHRIPKVKEI